MPARARIRRKRSHAVEALQGVLGGDLGMLGDERCVLDRRDGEVVAQPLGVLEGDTRLVAREHVGLRSEPLEPEVERVVRGQSPADGVHHPRPRPPAPDARVLEERDVAARSPRLVGVEEVVNGRVVLVHRLLHEPEAENPRVEVDVPRSVRGDARHVVNAVDPPPPRTPVALLHRSVQPIGGGAQSVEPLTRPSSRPGEGDLMASII